MRSVPLWILKNVSEFLRYSAHVGEKIVVSLRGEGRKLFPECEGTKIKSIANHRNNVVPGAEMEEHKDRGTYRTIQGDRRDE